MVCVISRAYKREFDSIYIRVCVHNNNYDEVGSLKDRSDERLCKPVTQYVSYSFSSLETGVCSILPW